MRGLGREGKRQCAKNIIQFQLGTYRFFVLVRPQFHTSQICHSADTSVSVILLAASINIPLAFFTSVSDKCCQMTSVMAVRSMQSMQLLR